MTLLLSAPLKKGSRQFIEIVEQLLEYTLSVN
jgi:hypothetical protein